MKQKKYYPSWKFHKSKAAIVVENEAEALEMAKQGYGSWAETYGDKQKAEHKCPAVQAAETYQEHQEKWESKDEKKAPSKRRKK